MKKSRRIFAISALVVVVAAAAGFVALQGQVLFGHYYLNDGQTPITVAVPSAVTEAGFAVEDFGNGTSRITVTYAGPFTLGSGRLRLEAVAGAPVGGSMSGIIASIGPNSVYMSSPQVGPNEAAVISYENFTVKSTAELGTTATGFTIDFPTAQLGGMSILSCTISYIPGEVDPATTMGDLDSATKYSLYRMPLGEGNFLLPGAPSPPISETGGATSMAPPPQAPPGWRHLPTPNWGPDPAFRGPGGSSGLQPVPPGSTLPKTSLGADGLQDDWVLAGGDIVPGTTDWIYKGVVIDNSTATMIIYRDRNVMESQIGMRLSPFAANASFLVP